MEDWRQEARAREARAAEAQVTDARAIRRPRASAVTFGKRGSRLGLPAVMRRVAILLLTAGVFVSAAFVLSACGNGKATEVGVTPGKLAPSFAGVTLEGISLSSESFRGKPYFLIYATSG